MMSWGGFQRLVDWSLGLLLLGSVVSSVGVYVWQSFAEERAQERHHEKIVTTMSTVFQLALNSKTEVLFDADDYSIALPMPAATDGGSETVVRVSDDAMNAVIQSMSQVTRDEDHLEPELFPPWKSLYEYFGKEQGTGDCAQQFIVHGRSDDGEISTCELLIANPKHQLLGYYRWDQ